MIRNLTLEDALYVVQHMRDLDRRCVMAILGGISDEDFAVNRWSSNGPAWTLVQERPCAIFGLSFQNEWSATAWLVATDEFASWKELIRFVKIVRDNAMNPEHKFHKHRIEGYVLQGWNGASRLVTALGAKLEGVKIKAGSNGENIEIWGLT